jgi:hypothetical protein
VRRQSFFSQLSFLVALFTLMFVATNPTSAQTVNGRIVGTVVDPTHAPVAGARIRVINAQTNQAREVITNETGDYVLSALPLGEYVIRAELKGFKAEVQQNVLVNSDQPIRVDIQLQVGDVAEVVTVTGASPVLQTDTSDVRSVVQTKELTQLPVISRLGVRTAFDQFLFIMPGTVRGYSGGIPVVGGAQGPGALSYSTDGLVSDNVLYAWGYNGPPSLDAVQSVEVETNAASAEFGSASTLMKVITKSGGNQFHGSLYEFNRNSAVAARNPFGLTAVPFLNRNEFGASVGGPIRKNRLFFFGWFEGTKQVGASSASSTVPTQLEKMGDFSQTIWPNTNQVVVPGFPAYVKGQVIPIYDPQTGQPFPGNVIPSNRISVAAALLMKSFYPDPNRPSHTSAPNFVFQPPTASGTFHFGGRVDQKISEKDSIFGSFQKNDNWPNQTILIGLPCCGLKLGDFISRGISINETHLFSPTLMNEIRGGWNRYNVTIGDLNHDFNYQDLGIAGYAAVNTAPVISVNQYTGISNNYKNDSWTSDYYIFMDNVTKVFGRHAMKFGGEFRWLKATELTGGTLIPNASFGFDGRYTAYGFADFLLGDVATASRTLSRGSVGVTQPQYHLFVQDDWRLTPKLTLNLGLRYELWRPYVELHKSVGGFNFKTGNMVVANGASVPIPDLIKQYFTIETASQAGLPSNLVQADNHNWAPRVGFAYQASPKTVVRSAFGIFYNPTTPGNGGVLDTAYGAPFQIGEQYFANPGPFPTPTLDIQNPYGVAQKPVPNVEIVAPNEVNPYNEQWNLTVEQQLASTVSFHVAYVGSHGLKLLSLRNLNQAFPGTGAIQARQPYPAYSVIQVNDSSGNSNYNSLQMDLQKRLSSGFLFRTNYTWQKSIVEFAGLSEAAAQNPRNMRAERAEAAVGARNVVNIAYVYELPFGPGKRFLNEGILGQIGEGWQVSGITTFYSGPYLTPSSGFDTANVGILSRADRICGGGLSHRTRAKYFDTSCFVMPATGNFGNSGRNVILGPGTEDFDISATKTFKVKELFGLQLRADAFNALNHVNPTPPNTTVTSPLYGVITGTQSDRVLQFGARLDF